MEDKTLPIILSKGEGGKGSFIRVMENILGREEIPTPLPSGNSHENYFPPLIIPLVIRVWPLLIDSLNFSG